MNCPCIVVALDAIVKMSNDTCKTHKKLDDLFLSTPLRIHSSCNDGNLLDAKLFVERVHRKFTFRTGLPLKLPELIIWLFLFDRLSSVYCLFCARHWVFEEWSFLLEATARCLFH